MPTVFSMKRSYDDLYLVAPGAPKKKPAVSRLPHYVRADVVRNLQFTLLVNQLTAEPEEDYCV